MLYTACYIDCNGLWPGSPVCPVCLHPSTNMAIAAALTSLQSHALDSPWRSLAVVAVLVPLLYVVFNEFTRASVRVKGIHGPSGLPLIGNLAQIRKNAAEQYRLWSKKYGSVYQIQLGNVPIVVINSAASAKSIFGQNAQALSSRPEFYTFHKVRLD
jgi:3-hydroxyphenylacetate 6-hydroxylase